MSSIRHGQRTLHEISLVTTPAPPTSFYLYTIFCIQDIDLSCMKDIQLYCMQDIDWRSDGWNYIVHSTYRLPLCWVSDCFSIVWLIMQLHSFWKRLVGLRATMDMNNGKDGGNEWPTYLQASVCWPWHLLSILGRLNQNSASYLAYWL